MKQKNIKSRFGLLLLLGMLFSTAAFTQSIKVEKGDAMFDYFNVFYNNQRGEVAEIRSLKEIDNLPQGTIIQYHRKSNDDVIYTTQRRVAIYTPQKGFAKTANNKVKQSSGGIIWKEAQMNQKMGSIAEGIFENQNDYNPQESEVLIDAEFESIPVRSNGEFVFPQAKENPYYKCGPWKWENVILDSMEVYSFYFDDFSFDDPNDAIEYSILQTIANGMNEATPMMSFFADITSERPDSYTKSFGFSHQSFDEDGNFLANESMSYFLLLQDSRTLPAGHDDEQMLGLKFSIATYDLEDGRVLKKYGYDLLADFNIVGTNYFYAGPGAFIGTELQEPLNPPTNLSADVTTGEVSWDAPQGNVKGYTVYQEATKLAQNITNTSYKLSDLTATRPYNIKVSTEYDTGNSLWESMSFDYNPPVQYPVVQNVNVDESSYVLTWDGPEFNTWISYNDDELDYTRGGNNQDSEIAIRFYPTQMHRFDGYFIQSIKFAPSENCEYSIRIWDDEDGNNLVHDQVITEDLTLNQWNEITLDTPYKIDGSKDLWIGIRANTQSGYPFYYDKSSCIAPTRSDLFRPVGSTQWQALSQADWPINLNWCISAQIDATGGEGQSAAIDFSIMLDDELINANAPGFEYSLLNHLTVEKEYSAGVVANYTGGSSEAVYTTFDYVMTGVDETVLSITSYPNPFDSYITISNAELVKRVVITNSLGQRVMDISLNGENTINTGALVQGIYLITLQGENGETVVRRMVKH